MEIRSQQRKGAPKVKVENSESLQIVGKGKKFNSRPGERCRRVGKAPGKRGEEEGLTEPVY